MKETSQNQNENILSKDYCTYSSLKMMFDAWKVIQDKHPVSFIEPIFGCLREISAMRRNLISIYFKNPRNSPAEVPLKGAIIAEGIPNVYHLQESKKNPKELNNESLRRFHEYLDGRPYSLEEQKEPRINGIRITVGEEEISRKPLSTDIYFKPRLMMLNKDCLDDEKYVLILTDDYHPFYKDSENPEFSARYGKDGWKLCRDYYPEKPLEARVVFHKIPTPIIFYETDSIFSKKPEKLREIVEKYSGAKRPG